MPYDRDVHNKWMNRIANFFPGMPAPAVVSDAASNGIGFGYTPNRPLAAGSLPPPVPPAPVVGAGIIPVEPGYAYTPNRPLASPQRMVDIQWESPTAAALPLPIPPPPPDSQTYYTAPAWQGPASLGWNPQWGPDPGAMGGGPASRNFRERMAQVPRETLHGAPLSVQALGNVLGLEYAGQSSPYAFREQWTRPLNADNAGDLHVGFGPNGQFIFEQVQPVWGNPLAMSMAQNQMQLANQWQGNMMAGDWMNNPMAIEMARRAAAQAHWQRQLEEAQALAEHRRKMETIQEAAKTNALINLWTDPQNVMGGPERQVDAYGGLRATFPGMAPQGDYMAQGLQEGWTPEVLQRAQSKAMRDHIEDMRQKGIPVTPENVPLTPEQYRNLLLQMQLNAQ